MIRVEIAIRWFCLSVLVGVYSVRDVSAQDSFESRAQQIIGEYDVTTIPGDIPKYGFWYAQANFASGKNTDAATVLTQTLSTTPDDPSFAYWSCMDAYLRWQSRYNTTLTNQTKNFMTSYTDYGTGSSQNHQVMFATARYLASEIWDFPSGSEFAIDDPTGKKHLMTKMNEWVRNGLIEHDSPIYIMFHLGPLRTLADYAKDPEIKQMARLAFEWILINAGNEWINGHWATSSLRNLFPYNAQNEYYETDFALWLYFGGVEPGSFAIGSLPRACFSIGMALSDYQLPEMIENIANKKDQVILNRESHAVGDEWQLEFRKTTFIDHDSYALYSQAELPSGQNSGLNEQSHRWGVVWSSTTSASQKSAFWMKHGRRDIAKNRAGTTKYEQVIQKDRTLAAVYNIPSDDSFPFAEGFVSSDLSAFDDSPTRIYLHYGNVLIAVISPKEILWNEGDDRIRSDHLKNGIVIETANPSRYAGTAEEELTAFKAEVESVDRLVGTDIDGENPKIVYQSIYGYTLSIQYEGDRIIDDVVIDYADWPLMENPWVSQEAGADTLTLTFGDTSRVYDFKNWKIVGEPEPVLALKDASIFDDASIFPNPASRKLIVSFPSFNADSLHASLVDASGKIRYRKSHFQVRKTRRLEIPITDFAKGLYWLKLTYGADTISRKILIEP
ncbi:MAG: T9SS type A sorting domain-containing protein [Cyclobacteriaceae bacterium]|nr:T9SS type A sorting domain-containing protein [Cyclobacteriaceae bacterium HetDA_MAG_MS6]